MFSPENYVSTPSDSTIIDMEAGETPLVFRPRLGQTYSRVPQPMPVSGKLPGFSNQIK